jgi:hypothetical protein
MDPDADEILDDEQDADGSDDRYAVLRPLLRALAEAEIRREILAKEAAAAAERCSKSASG